MGKQTPSEGYKDTHSIFCPTCGKPGDKVQDDLNNREDPLWLSWHGKERLGRKIKIKTKQQNREYLLEKTEFRDGISSKSNHVAIITFSSDNIVQKAKKQKKVAKFCFVTW